MFYGVTMSIQGNTERIIFMGSPALLEAINRVRKAWEREPKRGRVTRSHVIRVLLEDGAKRELAEND